MRVSYFVKVHVSDACVRAGLIRVLYTCRAAFCLQESRLGFRSFIRAKYAQKTKLHTAAVRT
jgi:hypothetical protein